MLKLSDVKLAIIGLGYVGLPLAVEFSKTIKVVGFDIDKKRVESLKNGVDSTLEVPSEEILKSEKLLFSSQIEEIKDSNVYIVTVPTPIDKKNMPDMNPLKKASKMLGEIIKNNDIVIYESTVYPGATEEVCIPIIEKESGLKFNKDFFAGYSPERINPGDKKNTLANIIKITSGSNKEVSLLVDDLYNLIISAGTHMVSSIKVAEAAKVIENTQRDLNIAIVNEFAKIFNKLEIDTQEVLEAAGTKWNFLPFKPGLVGGHCISVDPYYLTYKAKELGYQPEVMLAGRKINNGMALYAANQLVNSMALKNISIENAKVLILGFTFKGDCPDVRNTKVIDLVKGLELFNLQVDVSDHWADAKEVKREYKIELKEKLEHNSYDAIVLAVDHNDYRAWGEETLRKYGKKVHVIYDIKHVLEKDESDIRL